MSQYRRRSSPPPVRKVFRLADSKRRPDEDDSPKRQHVKEIEVGRTFGSRRLFEPRQPSRVERKPEERKHSWSRKPEERKPLESRKPQERKPFESRKPAERKPFESRKPAERKPFGFGKPKERKPLESRKPEEHKAFGVGKLEERKAFGFGKPEHKALGSRQPDSFGKQTEKPAKPAKWAAPGELPTFEVKASFRAPQRAVEPPIQENEAEQVIGEWQDLARELLERIGSDADVASVAHAIGPFWEADPADELDNIAANLADSKRFLREARSKYAQLEDAELERWLQKLGAV